jgi:hypothetical protein
LTLIVVNKDPSHAAQTTFSLNGFTPSQVTPYTLSQSSPNSIVPGSPQAWPANGTITFQPYTATLLDITGTTGSKPAAEWDLNPDTIAVAANSAVTIHPRLVSGAASLTLSLGAFDSGITLTITGSAVNGAQQGAIQISAGGTPGFYHFNVQASDGTTQGGWVVVNKPAAALSKNNGDNQTANAGTQLPQSLTVTLSPGQSGGSASGASVFFTTSAGTLSNGTTSGSKVIAVTNGSGVASVTLTLPASTGPVTVTAEGPYALGHPTVTFSETAN